VPTVDDRLCVGVALAAALAENRIQEDVDHHVRALDSELVQEPLDALAGLPHQDAAGYALVLAGILAQHQD
jgi:hypothetical protein